MNRLGEFLAIGTLAWGVLLAPPGVLAQDNPELGIDPSVSEQPPPPATATPPEPLPEAPPVIEPDPERPVGTESPGSKPANDGEQTDHDRVVGRLGVGFFGITRLPALLPAQAGNLATCVDSVCAVLDELEAPSIGVRYWLDAHLGLELAVGFHLRSGEIEVADPGMASATQDTLSTFGLALHAGVPLAVAGTSHLTFQIVPFLNVGATSGTVTDPVDELDDWDLSGFLLEVGANAGVELQFGFIGLPQLALQGTLGLAIQHQSASAEQGNGTLRSAKTTSVQTFVDHAPWEIFTGGVTAIYYF